MEATEYEWTFGLEDVEQAVWKAAEKRAPDLPMDDWVDVWMRGHPL